jgi:hypothetical protein
MGRIYKTASTTESIIYKGIKFNRYPNSKNPSHRKYYRPHANYIKQGITSLHREIWKDNFGKIPKGYDIHHKDHDFNNNSIDNLICISKKEHANQHAEENAIRGRSEKQLKHLNKIRNLTKEWHASQEGKEWHKQHVKNSLAKVEKKEFKCINCEKVFYSIITNSKCCCRKCYTKWYEKHKRKRKLIDKICKFCNKSFQADRKKTLFCSYSCSVKSRNIYM